jgi:molybdate transport system substrate-binding protein
MMRIKAFSLMLGLWWAATAHAVEIKVLCAGAYNGVLAALAPGFEQETGHGVRISNGTAGALQKRVTDGEAFDLGIVTWPVVGVLVKDGRMVESTRHDLAKVGIGVGIKAGAPKPDLSTEAAFKQLLINARAVAQVDPAAGGTSGIYLFQLYDRMGIGEQIRSKAVLVPGGYSAQRILTGEAEIAVQQMSEIVAVKGVELAGPLPDAVQNWTVYTAALSAKAAQADAARELLKYLTSDKAKASLASKGMVAP